MKLISLSNLQTTLVGMFAMFFKYALIIAGAFYISQWGTLLSVFFVLAYLVAEGFVIHFGTDDVIILEKDEEADEE